MSLSLIAPVYWDPTSLLQFEGAFGCRVITKRGYRCSSSGIDRQRKIRQALARLSHERPEYASIATLETLASLSMCGLHTSYPPLLSNWMETIQAANKHHQYLLQFDLADLRRDLDRSNNHLNELYYALDIANDKLKDAVAMASKTNTQLRLRTLEKRDLEKQNAATTAKLSAALQRGEHLQKEIGLVTDSLSISKADTNRLYGENRSIVERNNILVKKGATSQGEIARLSMTLKNSELGKRQLEEHLKSQLRDLESQLGAKDAHLLIGVVESSGYGDGLNLLID
ncbi:uncharacterized protein B0J16DRAFT_400299 [Fusarium flagelliforme]|uniref:uncharacterized protein n=1 Tax=Fusarium flagelliforme TaxID=2675880 RepID=UPI001E8DD88B|nr:uncharacterized protein B0J16DRAFT_400299 [Fusarium flagelliforme]KAH7186244.1 hypothetical protein B0J16DRAFT_400299 [Fusarium flagelliforme]